MQKSKVLILDDDPAFAKKLVDALNGLFHVEGCYSEDEFRSRFAVGRFDLLIVDMRLKSDREGLILLREVMAQDPSQMAIIMTAYADSETYVDAIQAGALNYFDKREFSPILIARSVEAIIQQGRLRRRIAVEEHRQEAEEPLEIIGVSPLIRWVREKVRRAADEGDLPVLLVGETGSGRKLAARNIHRLNRRRAEDPFVRVMCGKLLADEFRAQLFGTYSPGGNRRGVESRGWLDDAKGGVLLLDGAEELDRDTAAELCNLITTSTFVRAGGGRKIEANSQIVISFKDVNGGILDAFRGAVRHRGGKEFRMPALRERREDISLLANYSLQNIYRRGISKIRALRDGALSLLEKASWPGNVRELNLSIEYAAIVAGATGRMEIGAEHLPSCASESPLGVKAPAAFDYLLNRARARVALVEAAIERFKAVRQVELLSKLGYKNRQTFSRHVREAFRGYPGLIAEFPLTARLFGERKDTIQEKEIPKAGKRRA